MGIAATNLLGQIAYLAAWGILQGKDDAKVPAEESCNTPMANIRRMGDCLRRGMGLHDKYSLLFERKWGSQRMR